MTYTDWQAKSFLPKENLEKMSLMIPKQELGAQGYFHFALNITESHFSEPLVLLIWVSEVKIISLFIQSLQDTGKEKLDWSWKMDFLSAFHAVAMNEEGEELKLTAENKRRRIPRNEAKFIDVLKIHKTH